jgi:hypothetical protein
MADNFSQEQVQSVFGGFVPVMDETVDFSQDNVQSVFGEYVFVLDEAAGAAGGGLAIPLAFQNLARGNQ